MKPEKITTYDNIKNSKNRSNKRHENLCTENYTNIAEQNQRQKQAKQYGFPMSQKAQYCSGISARVWAMPLK